MVYVAVYAASLPAGFLVYSYLAYRSVYKGAKPKYPMVPPEGKTDAYFPRTDIPRPVYEDARRYPAFFGRRKKRKLVKAERVEKARRKK